MSETNSEWETIYENVYDKSLGNWYGVFGNHDMRGRISAQLKYSNISSRWNVPYNYYYKDYNILKSNKLLRIIYIDTNSIICKTDDFDSKILSDFELYECSEAWYKIDDEYKQTKGIYREIYDNENFVDSDTQLKWLHDIIMDSHNDNQISMILITGHHPLWSEGPHKIPQIFNEKMKPILNLSPKLNGWLAGHNHILEHSIWKRDNMHDFHTFLSGSGSCIHDVESSDAEITHVESQLNDVKIKLSKSKYGFVSITVMNENCLHVLYWDEYGNNIYTTQSCNYLINSDTITDI